MSRWAGWLFFCHRYFFRFDFRSGALAGGRRCSDLVDSESTRGVVGRRKSGRRRLALLCFAGLFVLAPSAAQSTEIVFVENAGQFDPAVRFQARAGDLTVFAASDHLWLTWRNRDQYPDPRDVPAGFSPVHIVNLKLSFVGCGSNSIVNGEESIPTRLSYFAGSQTHQWHGDVPAWKRVRYQELCPNVDLLLEGVRGRPRLRLVADGQRDLRRLQLVLEGAEGFTNDEGDLILPDGVRLALPTISAELRNGDAVQLPPGWPLTETTDYAPPPLKSDRLVGVTYAGFLGGSEEDCSFRCAMTIDDLGAVYVTGLTDSPDFPTTPGAYDTSVPVQEDAFVVKIAADGSTLVYATLLGGGDEDWGRAIAVDGGGRAIVTGHTRSGNFPTTVGAFDRTHEDTIYPDDGFVTILSADGSDLVYSTYFGGSAEEIGKGIAVDSDGGIIVAGATQSSNFPTTPGAYDPTYNPPSPGGGEMDAFVLKLDPAGAGSADLVYGTFIGGGFDEWVDALEIDDAGAVYVAGTTGSSTFPTTPGAWITGQPGARDGFVAKLNSEGSALVFSTFVGSSGDESADAVAVNGNGQVVVEGNTNSGLFPTTPGAYDLVLGGDRDIYVVMLEADGSTPVFSTFVGGSDGEYSGSTLAFATDGSVIATGGTRSSNFPTTPGCPDQTLNGLEDAVVFLLDSSGATLRFGTYLGGWHWDFGYGVEASARGAVVVGRTRSHDFPATAGDFGDTFGGGTCLAGQPCTDAFVAELEISEIFIDGFESGDTSAWD